MAVDATIALVSVDEARAFLGLDESLEDQPLHRLEYIINSVSRIIKKRCDRDFIAVSSATTEYFFGNDTSEYRLRNAPILTASPTYAAPTNLYYQVSSTTWLESTATWTYHATKGLIYFQDGSVFSKPLKKEGIGNWKIDYFHGYALADVPIDLKMACCDIIGLYLKRFEKNLHGHKSQTTQAGTTSFDWNNWPADVRNTILSYKRKWF